MTSCVPEEHDPSRRAPADRGGPRHSAGPNCYGGQHTMVWLRGVGVDLQDGIGSVNRFGEPPFSRF